MGTGWADAAGALSVAQDTGDLAGLLRARLLASKIAAAQANAQAMDATGSEKVGPALASAAQADFLARRKGMDPTEDRIQKRNEFQTEADLKKQAAAEKAREFGITSGQDDQRIAQAAANASETGRHNKAEENIDWGRIKASTDRRGTLTPSQTIDEITKLNKSYTGNTKGERQIVANYHQMQSAIKSLDDPNIQNQTAATKAIIDAFERTLNPGGVVRQTAFQQDVGHQSAMDTLYGKFQQLTAGGHGMTPQNLKAFAAQVEPLARDAQQKIDRERARITNMATPYGLPTDQIFTEEDNPFAAQSPAAPAAGGETGGALAVGTQRTINGTPAMWDGHGWVAR